MLSSIITRLTTLHDWAIDRPYVGVLVRAGDSGIEHQGRDSAASIAYYTLLSLFPLILGFVSIGGFFLKSEVIQLRVNDLILEVLPVSAEFVTRNIESLVRIRGASRRPIRPGGSRSNSRFTARERNRVQQLFRTDPSSTVLCGRIRLSARRLSGV